MDFPTCIIGAGKLGSTLALAFHKIDNLKYLVDISDSARDNAKILLPDFTHILSKIEEITVLPKFVFLTVNDDLIEQSATHISNTFAEKLKGRYIIHCSGSLSVKVLESCKQYGAITAAIHPYQTFYQLSDDVLNGIAWSIRSEFDSDILENLVKQIGGNPYVIDDDDSLLSLYHSSAVVSSNFMTALISLAREIAKLSTIDGNLFMPAIINTTIENNFNSKDFPLTGPYARGDIQTIKRHLDALSSQPQLKNTYIYMALATLEQLQYYNSLDKKTISEMKDILKNSLI